MISEICFSIATEADAFPLMQLFQKAAMNAFEEALFLDHTALARALTSETSVWVIGKHGQDVVSVLSVTLEKEHLLAKIHRMYVDPFLEDQDQILHNGMHYLINYLKGKAGTVEIIYATSRTLSQTQLEFALQMKFKVLGVFPISNDTRNSGMSILVAYFFTNVLSDRRNTDFPLHPDIHPLYEITRRECDLNSLPVAKIAMSAHVFEPLPILEMIRAPNFVARRFNFLKERKFLSINFYPFQEPNAIITDPDQKVEIFVKIAPELRFATIIGERIELAVNPSDLYKAISTLLYNLHISYIEIINDAADTEGLENILHSGFLPCAYFPALKCSEETRRDFIILWKSFERLTFPGIGETKEIFLDYLDKYFRLEREHLKKGNKSFGCLMK